MNRIILQYYYFANASILRNHQIVRVIILSTYLFRRREKNSLFKILVYHCQLNHNLWSYQSSTTKVSSVHNKHMTYPICRYDLTVLSSNLQINLVVCLNGSEVSRTRTLAADETPGHIQPSHITVFTRFINVRVLKALIHK